jgi:hypothetical protein
MVTANGFWGNQFETKSFWRLSPPVGPQARQRRPSSKVFSTGGQRSERTPIEMRVGKKLKAYTTEICGGRILKT